MSKVWVLKYCMISLIYGIHRTESRKGQLLGIGGLGEIGKVGESWQTSSYKINKAIKSECLMYNMVTLDSSTVLYS